MRSQPLPATHTEEKLPPKGPKGKGVEQEAAPSLPPSFHYHIGQILGGSYPSGWLGGEASPAVPLLGEREGGTKGVLWVPIASLVPNPETSRAYYDPKYIEELSSSIEREGLLYPLVVRKEKEGFVILDGHYRYYALLRLGMSHEIEPMTVPVLLAGNRFLPPLRQTSLAVLLNVPRPYSPLDRVLAFLQVAFLGGIPADTLFQASRYVNRLKAQGNKGDLPFWAGFLEALRIYGLTPSMVSYYLRIFQEHPDLFLLAKEKRIPDTLLRTLVRSKMRPYLPELIHSLRNGASPDEVERRAKEILASLRPTPQERAYAYLYRARRLLGDEGVRQYLAHMEVDKTDGENRFPVVP